MNLLTIIFLSFLSMTIVAEVSEPIAAAMIEMSTPEAATNNFIYVLKSLLENAKFWTYKDINDTSEKDTIESLSITNIHVTGLVYNISSAHNQVELKSGNITFKAKKEFVIYVFTFNWKAMAMGIHIAFGTGKVGMNTEYINVIYNPVKFESSIDANFTVNIIDITGRGSYSSNIRVWIKEQIETKTVKELIEGIKYNKRFFQEYLNSNLKLISKNIKNNYTLSYMSKPIRVKQYKNYLIYYYDVFTLLNSGTPIRINATMEPITTSHSTCLLLSARYIAETIKIYGSLGMFDFEVNMTTFNYSGTVAEFSEVLPNLLLTYNMDEKIRMFCEYTNDNIEVQEKQEILLPINCKFRIRENITVLDSKIIMKMDYAVDIRNNLFAAKFHNLVPQNCRAIPDSQNIIMFLMDLFYHFSIVGLGEQLTNLPLIRYDSLTGDKKIEVHATDQAFIECFD